jgi:hypothetical protein
MLLFWYVISTHISAPTALNDSEILFVGSGLSSGSVLVQLLQCICSSAIARRAKRKLKELREQEWVLILEGNVEEAKQAIHEMLSEMFVQPKRPRANIEWDVLMRELTDLLASSCGQEALMNINYKEVTNNTKRLVGKQGVGESSLGDDVITLAPWDGEDDENVIAAGVKLCRLVLTLVAGEAHHEYHWKDGKGEFGRGPESYYFLGRSLLSFHLTVREIDDTLGSWLQPEHSAKDLLHLWLRMLGLIADNVFSPAAYLLLLCIEPLEDQLLTEGKVTEEGEATEEIHATSLSRSNWGLTQLLQEVDVKDLLGDLFGATVEQKTAWIIRLHLGLPRNSTTIPNPEAEEALGGWLGVPKTSRYLRSEEVDALTVAYSNVLEAVLPGVRELYLEPRGHRSSRGEISGLSATPPRMTPLSPSINQQEDYLLSPA